MSDEIVHEDPPVTAKMRLRAFEDKVMGAEAPRINGHVERGHGSLFQRMSHDQKHHYSMLEKLVATEEKVAHTSVALAAAEAEHAAALKAADKAEGKPDGDE